MVREQGELGATLQTSSEGGRQRYGSKVNSECLCILLVKEVGRGIGAR